MKFDAFCVQEESLSIILTLFQKILFAGEATHSEMFGSVQGAMFSGYREARRLSQIYGYSI